MRKIFIPILLFVALSLFGNDLPDLSDLLPQLSESELDILRTEGEWTRFTMDDLELRSAPDTEMGELISSSVSDAELTVGIEALFLYKGIPQDELDNHLEDVLLRMYNILLSVKTLEGLEYYSASRGHMRILFEESWIIDNPYDKNPQDDFQVKSIPENSSFFIHQKDKTFGNSESRMTHRRRGNEISASIINLTPMRYNGLIKVIDPEKMVIHIIIEPTSEGVLFYGMCGAQTLKIRAFEDKASNSFYNRVKALYSWFRSSLEDNQEEVSP